MLVYSCIFNVIYFQIFGEITEGFLIVLYVILWYFA